MFNNFGRFLGRIEGDRVDRGIITTLSMEMFVAHSFYRSDKSPKVAKKWPTTN